MSEGSSVSVTLLPNTSILRIKQTGERILFASSDNIIIISIPALTFLLKFLVQNKYVSKKALEGILSELSE